ncbi:MAG: asparaginase [Rothia sp. (in: high G+C Gram-positive bacteria)]|nr:asparaginase [Rothia sp. (in: high G+C Gram-positive bacteria)]
MQTFTAQQAAELALVTRGDFIESRHLGSLVVLAPDGSTALSFGSPQALIYARSALKPLQAIASMNAGAELQGAQIALAAGSHTGSFEHMKVAQSVLAEAGLTADALLCPPAWPTDEPSYHALIRAGHGQQRLAFNCSGKHAAFLWGCVKSGWPTENYTDPSHPLQELVLDTLEEFTGERPQQLTVDGCGAPLAATSLLGLARAYSTLGAAVENIKADARAATVATAMVDYPEYIHGHGGSDTVLAETLNAVVKRGAEGVLAIGLRSGASVALKVLDGSNRAASLVAVRALQAAGFLEAELADRAVARSTFPISGGGQPVGSIEPGAAFEGLL